MPRHLSLAWVRWFSESMKPHGVNWALVKGTCKEAPSPFMGIESARRPRQRVFPTMNICNSTPCERFRPEVSFERRAYPLGRGNHQLHSNQFAAYLGSLVFRVLYAPWGEFGISY